MTILLANGFDTTPSNADLRTQGWLANPPAVPTSGRAFSSPLNNTGIPGRALILAAYPNHANQVGVAQNGDPAFIDTGKTVKQLWDAGGFVIGARMKFNTFDNTGFDSENDGWTGGLSTIGWTSARQVAVDGNSIYAIRKTTDAGTTYVLQKSTDLGVTWTTLNSPPPNALTVESTLNIVEPGTLMVTRGSVPMTTGATYTKDDGATWTTIAAFAGKACGECIATGVPAYPYAFAVGAPNGVTGQCGVWLSTGNIDGPWVYTARITGTPPAYQSGPLKFLPGLDSKLYCAFTAGWYGVVDLTTGTGTLTQIAGMSASNLYTLDYIGGLIVMATGTGVYSAPAFGGPWNLISSQVFQTSVVDGTTVVFGGSDSAVYSTSDGLALSGSSYNSGPALSGVAWRGLRKVSNRYVGWMDNGGLWLCDNPRLLLNAGWSCMRWPDKAEAAVRAQSGFGLVGAVAGSLVPSNGTFTVADSPQGVNTSGLWITAGPTASGARPVTIQQPGLAALASTSIPVSKTLTNLHYYEIIAVADTGTVNKFFYALRIDGGYYVPKTTVSLALAGPTDTTSRALINLPRTGNWTKFDDLYLTDYSGTANAGVIGPLNIMRRTMSTDVTTEWTRKGTASTDAASVTKDGITTDLSNYVTSTTAGAKEVFGTTAGSTPDLSAYVVRAIQVEAYARKASPGDPDLVLGVGGVESAPIPMAVSAAPTFVAQTFPVDSTGKAWKVANVPGLNVTARNS